MMALFVYTGAVNAQLSDEEYAYVTMDLRGILDLTMTTDPQVDFVFESIQDYQMGITKFNATKLEVDATVAWDLFAHASSDNWVPVETYSTTGTSTLPAEILQIQSTVENTATGANPNFDGFANLLGATNSGVAAGLPAAGQTQFLAGTNGIAANESFAPGTAAANPATNQFRLHYRIVPGIPADFSTGTNDVDLTGGVVGATDFAKAGYYYLEIVYSLVEDL